ncbi:MAG: hypothetical protein WBG70_01660 [Spirulinaceae cyanobacterium]
MTTKTKTSLLIIFKAEPDSKHGWSQREDGIGGLTNTLAEHSYYDPHAKVPEVGYRFWRFQPNPTEHEPRGLDSRNGDWVVTRVERYQAISSEYERSEVAICYCKYSPVPEQWEQVPTLDELRKESIEAVSPGNQPELTTTNQE